MCFCSELHNRNEEVHISDGNKILTFNCGSACVMPNAVHLRANNCHESIPGMKNDVTFSSRGHINHAITISSSLDTNLESSPLPLHALSSAISQFFLSFFYPASLSLSLCIFFPSLPPCQLSGCPLSQLLFQPSEVS